MRKRRKAIVEELEEAWQALLAEHPRDGVRNRLQWEDWETLRSEAREFARGEIRRRKWRGAQAGTLPGGVEPDDIAGEAIGDLFNGRRRLAVGWTRERLVRELKRLVANRVRLLHRLKEASAMRSEWEVIPAGEDGKAASIFDLMAGEDGGEAERRETRGRFLKDFEKSLGAETELEGVFRCLCDGARTSGEIAQRLGIPEAEVRKARRRLRRKIRKVESRKQK